jgi:HEAT repeat protein
LIVLALSCRAPAPPLEDSIPRLEDERHPESAELVAALRDEDSARRARAALAMGRIQSAAYVEPLAAATKDDDRTVRLAALFALGQQGLLQGGRPAQAAIDGCLPSLDDTDAEIVTAALEALGKLAGPAVPPLVVPFLDHDVADVRAAAAMALFRCRFAPLWRGETTEAPPLPAAAVEALLDGMDDPDGAARLMKVYTFSRYAQPEAATALAGLVTDEDEWVRLFAVRGIGRAGQAEAASALESALHDTVDRVRTEAVGALAALGLAHRIPDTLAADRSIHVRVAVADALGGVVSGESLSVLERLEQDPSTSVRGAAVEALARRLGGEYDLAKRLADTDWRIRVAAAGAAGHLGEGAAAIIESAMRDDDPRVRTAALAALEPVTASRDILFEALQVDDLAVRGTAVESLPGAVDRSLRRLAGCRVDRGPRVDRRCRGRDRRGGAAPATHGRRRHGFLGALQGSCRAGPARHRATRRERARGRSLPHARHAL